MKIIFKIKYLETNNGTLLILLRITEDYYKQRLKENINFMGYLFKEFLFDTLTMIIIFHGVKIKIFHNNKEIP